MRLDHTVSSSSEVAVRYSFADRSLFEPFSGPGFSVVPGYGNDVPRRAQNLMISETIFSPVHSKRIAARLQPRARGVLQEAKASASTGKSACRSSTNPSDFGLTFITVPGFSPLGDEVNNPQQGVTNTYQMLDGLTYTHGHHLLKFGAEFRAQQQNAFRDVQSRGFLIFSGYPLAIRFRICCLVFRPYGRRAAGQSSAFPHHIQFLRQ